MESRNREDQGGSWRSDRWFYSNWVHVFVFNLPMPVLLGMPCATNVGLIGMLLAVIVLFDFGNWICMSSWRYRPIFLAGALLLILTQIAPVLQIASGLIGLSAGDYLGVVDEETRYSVVGRTFSSETGAFIVTIVTGLFLMGISMILGFLAWAATPRDWWYADAEADRPTRRIRYQDVFGT